jgi:SAM-dependent methyltransferase
VRKAVTDSDWEALGQTEPYFGVLTDQSYAGPSIDDEAVEALMTTGRAYFDELLHSLDGYGLRKDWGRSLDFGCCVGRVTIPIAKRSASTVGVDVSRGMLFEAKRNLIRAGVSTASLVQASDHLCLKNEGVRLRPLLHSSPAHSSFPRTPRARPARELSPRRRCGRGATHVPRSPNGPTATPLPPLPARPLPLEHKGGNPPCS